MILEAPGGSGEITVRIGRDPLFEGEIDDMGFGCQVVALLYYLLSYFPGGADSVRFFLRLFYSAFVQCLGIVQRSVLR